MNTNKIIYRPPMEYDSLIVQVTLGCAHNKCTFCTMYKDREFSIMSISNIISELRAARRKFPSIKKIFLADGDAFVLSTKKILEILRAIKEIFPECNHVASYGRFTDVIRKTPEDLKILKENGLEKLYLGMESGSQDVLDMVNKNSSPEIIARGARLLKDAGITTYFTVLLGLGGQELSEEHIEKTAKLLNKTNPDFISLMTLIISENMELMKDIRSGKFNLISPNGLVEEAINLVEKLELDSTTLRINHASNFVNLEGRFPVDKKYFINNLKDALDDDLKARDRYRSF